MALECARAAVNQLEDMKGYVKDVSALINQNADTLKKHPLLIFDVLVGALPSEARRACRPIDLGKDFENELSEFNRSWLNGSENGHWAIQAGLATLCPALISDAAEALRRPPLQRAILDGDKERATTGLHRNLARSARRNLRNDGFHRRQVEVMAADADLWASVWVRHQGRLRAAIESGALFSGRYVPDLSKSLSPFNEALGIRFPRGRRPDPDGLRDILSGL